MPGTCDPEKCRVECERRNHWDWHDPNSDEYPCDECPESIYSEEE